MEEQIEIGKLTVKAREQRGKGAARKLRAAGFIPGVLYGGGKEALALALDPIMLMKALDPEKQRNTVFELTIESGGSTVQEKAMIKDYQIDAIRQDLQHADFIRIAADEVMRLHVPLELTGRSPGVQLGGTLHQVFRTLEVECTPEHIPSHITADISSMEIGDSLSIEDLQIPAGVRVLLPPQQTCVQVYAPRAADATEAAEGEVAAEGEGAAPAGSAEGEAAK